MHGWHYSDKSRKESGDSWEEQTERLLRGLFPNDRIEEQVKFPQLPHNIIDFYIPRIRVAVESKGCGLTPVPKSCDDNCPNCDRAEKCGLLKHQRIQNTLKSQGIKYVWWVDRERASLVPRTRKYLENVFYNCSGEEERFVKFLKTCESF